MNQRRTLIKLADSNTQEGFDSFPAITYRNPLPLISLLSFGEQSFSLVNPRLESFKLVTTAIKQLRLLAMLSFRVGDVACMGGPRRMHRQRTHTEDSVCGDEPLLLCTICLSWGHWHAAAG